jgi:hypothetical protein
MATMTETEIKAQALQDARVLALKEAGATWRFIATEMGWGWNGANMDGGRAKRAYLRALKAQVDPAEVKLPKALTAKLEKAKAPKAAPAPKPKAARKPKAKPEEDLRTIPTLEECAVKPLAEAAA